MWNNRLQSNGFAILLATAILTLLLSDCSLPKTETVEVGYVGLLVNRATGELIDSNIIRPSHTLVGFNHAILVFPTTPQKLKLQFNVYTRDSVEYEVEITVIYHLQEENVSRLYETYSGDYPEVLVEPETKLIFRNAIRSVHSDIFKEMTKVDFDKDLRDFYLNHYLVLDEIQSLQLMRISPL
jgi:hypothetical protein